MSENVPFSALSETHAIFAGAIGFMMRELIAKGITTEERAVERMTEIEKMLTAKGASAGAKDLAKTLACLFADAPPPSKPRS